MKNPIALLAFIFTTNIYAQVGIGTTTPNASSALDINSTTKGLLPPRMTASQRNSIDSPAPGLFIWCSDCGFFGEAEIYNGLVWTNMVGGTVLDSLLLGESYQGGIIAYFLQPADPGYNANVQHGLIAPASDQATNALWGCAGTGITGADGTDIGTGNQNTLDIVNGCMESGIAAMICNDLVLGGYSDWYLPSKDELSKLYLNRVAIGGFATGFYWSSSESNNTFSWLQNFNDGTQTTGNKGFGFFVRAIRSF